MQNVFIHLLYEAVYIINESYIISFTLIVISCVIFYYYNINLQKN